MAFLVVATFLVVLLGGAEVLVLAGRLACGLGFGLAVVLALVVLRRVVLVVLVVVLAVVLRCVVLLVVVLLVLVILGVVEGGARTAVAFLPGGDGVMNCCKGFSWSCCDLPGALSMQHFMLGEGQGTSSSTS